MHDNLIRDLFRYLANKGGFTVGEAQYDIERRIEELPLPLDVKRLLQWEWPTTTVEVGPYTLYPPEAVLGHNDLDELLTAKMLPVGHALNGDILVIFFPDEDQAGVGLVSHEELWSEETTPDLAYVQITASIEEYLYRAAEGRFLPIDSYSANELAAVKSDMRELDGA